MQWSTGLNGTPDVDMKGELASDGAIIFPDACDQAFNWNGDGTLNYAQIVVPATPGTLYTGGTYRQTFGYSTGVLASVSRWVKV